MLTIAPEPIADQSASVSRPLIECSSSFGMSIVYLDKINPDSSAQECPLLTLQTNCSLGLRTSAWRKADTDRDLLSGNQTITVDLLSNANIVDRVSGNAEDAQETVSDEIVDSSRATRTEKSVIYRTLVIVTRRLEKITILEGTEFVKAWLDAVTYHAFLWKYGIEHSDPSLWNLKYNPQGHCGILVDFDMEVLLDLPSTQIRRGTIPFMSLELLDEDYWSGEIKRYYHHELEAFVWILMLVFMGYSGGIFDRTAPCISSCLQLSYKECARKKEALYLKYAHYCSLKPGFQIYDVLFCTLLNNFRAGDLDTLKLRLKHRIERHKPSYNHKRSNAYWNGFIDILRHNTDGLEVSIDRLLLCKPEFPEISDT